MAQQKGTKAHRTNDPVLTWIFQTLRAFGYAIVFLFLIANILYSQMMPDMYFALASNANGSFVEFVQKARRLDSFWKLSPQIKDLIGLHSQEIYADTTSRHGQINLLKQSLEVHPRSPEILYSLYLLYHAEGEDRTAVDYLNQARALDPMVGEK